MPYSRRDMLLRSGGALSIYGLSGCLRSQGRESSMTNSTTQKRNATSERNSVEEKPGSPTDFPNYPISLTERWQIPRFAELGEIHIQSNVLYLVFRGVEAYRLSDGKRLWHSKTTSSVYPIDIEDVGNNVIIRTLHTDLGNARGLRSVSATDGTKQWERIFEDWDYAIVDTSTPDFLVVSVFRSPGKSSYYILNRDDGTTRWKSAEKSDLTSAVIVGSELYISDDKNNITLIYSLETGDRKGTLENFELGNYYYDGKLVAGTSAFDLENKTEYTLVENVKSTSEYNLINSTYYIVTNSGITAVDLDSMEQLWDKVLDYEIISQPKIQPHVIWAVNNQGELIGLNHSGNIVYRNPLVPENAQRDRPGIEISGNILVFSESLGENPSTRVVNVNYDS